MLLSEYTTLGLRSVQTGSISPCGSLPWASFLLPLCSAAVIWTWAVTKPHELSTFPQDPMSLLDVLCFPALVKCCLFGLVWPKLRPATQDLSAVFLRDGPARPSYYVSSSSDLEAACTLLAVFCCCLPLVKPESLLIQNVFFYSFAPPCPLIIAL